MLKEILMVGAGSALGGMLRHLVGRLVHTFWPQPFPLATLAVNVAGCLLIGLVFGHAQRTGSLSTATLLLLATGLCGGFTTMSAFAYENILLMRSGAYTMVVVYITASVVLGVLAAWLGLELMR